MSLSKFTFIKELYRFIPDSFITGEDTDLSLDDVVENGAELRYYNEDENDLDIEPIKTLLDSLLEITTHKPQTDFDISSKIHHLFNEAGMNRIIAANGDVWDFLTVFYFNDYLCWRWKKSPNKERFFTLMITFGGDLNIHQRDSRDDFWRAIQKGMRFQDYGGGQKSHMIQIGMIPMN